MRVLFVFLLLLPWLCAAQPLRCQDDPAELDAQHLQLREQLAQRYFPFHVAPTTRGQHTKMRAIQVRMTCSAFGRAAIANLPKRSRALAFDQVRDVLIAKHLVKFRAHEDAETKLYKKAFPQLASYLAEGYLLKRCRDVVDFELLIKGQSIGVGSALSCKGATPIVMVLDEQHLVIDIEKQGDELKLRAASLENQMAAIGVLPQAATNSLELQLVIGTGKAKIFVTPRPNEEKTQLAVYAKNIPVNQLAIDIAKELGGEALRVDLVSSAKAGFTIPAIPTRSLLQLIADVSTSTDGFNPIQPQVLTPKLFGFWETSFAQGNSELGTLECPDKTCSIAFPLEVMRSKGEVPDVMYITESRKHGVLFKDIWFARMQEQYLNADFADQVRVSRVGYKPVWMYKSECDEFGTSMQMMVPRSNMAQFLSICSASSPQVLGAIVASFSVKAPEHEPKNPFADRAIRPAREHRIAYIASRISQGDFEPLERFQLNKTLRKDPEFSRLAQYAADFSAYWDSLERARILFAVPKQADFTKPVPLIFALHGYGSVPEDFLSQSLADESGAIVVAISGTNARPSGGYSWSEIADADSLHLQFAEDFVKSKLPNLVVGPRLLFGFSQGAQMSLEIAARFPERYLGAAAFSPGTLGALDLAWLKPGTTLKKRYFVVHVNNEDPRNVAWAKSDNKRLKAAGASVEFELNMAIRSHGVPANYEQHLLRWVQRSLQK